MTKIKYILILILVFLGFYSNMFASHIVGGEMGYRCLGNNQYEIRLNVYRDCLNASPNALFDNPASIGIFNREGLLVLDLLVRPLMVNGRMIDDTLSYDESDPCLVSPPNVCVHTTTYLDTVELPNIPGGYEIVYQRCCRNATISNIQDPVATGATFDIMLTEEAMAICNSSPDINFWPPIFVCYGQPLTFDHSATDNFDQVEDSLVYKLCQPKAGGNLAEPRPQPPNNPPYDTIAWISTGPIKYSLENVLGLGEPLKINPSTGLMSGLPELEGQFVVGLCIEEYNRATGNLLSVTRRDFQYNVAQCGIVTAVYDLPATTCDSLTYSFNNRSLESSRFIWFFNWPDRSLTSTLARPTFTFPGPGTYTVALIAEPNTFCSDTLFRELVIHGNAIQPDFDVQVISCVDSPVLVLTDKTIDTAAISSYFWDIRYGSTTLTSNLQNPYFPVPFGVSGTIKLTVINQYGCTSSISKNFTANVPNLLLNIPNILEGCLGDSVQLNPNTPDYPGYFYLWQSSSFSDTSRNPKVLVSGDETYYVTITAGGGACFVTDTLTLKAVAPPSLDFNFKQSCKSSVTVQFENLSTGANSFVWNFGDPTNPSAGSDRKNPLYTFPDTGNYLITLALASSEVCRDTLKKIIDLDLKILEADFEIEFESCNADSMNIVLRDKSFNSDNNTVSWNWQLSNGLNFSVQNPTFSLGKDTTLDIRLVITDNNQCTQQLDRKNIPFRLAKIPATPDSAFICFGYSTQLPFVADSFSVYTWSPVTGISNSNIANPLFSPTTSTEYELNIFTISADTCQITKNTFIEVSPSSQMLIEGAGLSCDPTSTVSVSSPLNVSFKWFSEASVLLGQGNSITLPLSGRKQYFVESLDSNNGCDERKSFELFGGPVDVVFPDFIAVCEGEELLVNPENKDNLDTISYFWPSIEWIVSGQNSATPDFREEVGENFVTVIATNQFGCTLEDSILLVVIDTNYQLSFTFEFECDGATLNFTNTSQDAFAYLWDFGDGTTSRQINPTHTYTAAGTYVVSLRQGYEVSCDSTIFKDTIHVAAVELAASFDAQIETCGSDKIGVRFFDTSINIFGNQLTYEWTFSNGLTSTQPNPLIEITEAGLIDVRLAILSQNGCAAFVEKSYSFYIPKIALPDSLIICRGIATPLNPNPDLNLEYFWSPAIGLDDPFSPNPIVTPNQTTLYTLSARFIGFDTCQIIQSILVVVPDSMNLVTTENMETCGEDVTLEASANPGVSLLWKDSLGNILGGGNASVVVNPFREGLFTVEARDPFSCMETKLILITDLGIDIKTDFPIGADTSFCEGDTLFINILNQDELDELQFNWIPSSIVTFTDIPGNIKIRFTEDNEVLTGIITNQHGCKDTVTLTADMTPLNPGLSDTIFTCPGVPFNLGENADDIFIYEWSPSSFLNNTSIPNPIGTIFESTLFTAKITYPGTVCTAEVQVFAEVYQPIEFELGPDTTLCSADQVILRAMSLSTISVRWSQTNSFENSIGSGLIFGTLSQPGQVFFAEVTDSNNCILVNQILIGDGVIQADIDPLNPIICSAPEPLQLEVLNAKPAHQLSYIWEPAAEVLSDPFSGPTALVDGGDSMTYYIYLSNQFGCVDTLTTTIIYIDLSGVIAGALKDTLFPRDTTSLFAEGCDDCDYTWSPSSSLSNDKISNPIATPPTSTEYRLIAEKRGCAIEIPVNVVVRDDLPCDEPYIFIPNAFTPNGDGTNDLFRVRSELIIQLEMRIFNRWGEKVFQTSQLDSGWDGTYQGKILSPDVFGYFVEATCYNGEKFVKKGNVTLLQY
jgi:gliding motility-associated-like protein